MIRSPGALLDAGTRWFWRLAGRPCDLAGEYAWLQAPTSGAVVGDRWVRTFAEVVGGSVVMGDDDGLLPDFSALASAGFDPARVAPSIHDFYEHTSAWQLDVWSQWTPVFAPFGALIGALFGRRVQQLALPIEPLAVSRGMDSEVRRVVVGDGHHHGSAWLRRLRSTGDHVFSGYYQVGRLPGREDAVVHVSFPLESGNVQVFLTPSATPDGGFRLSSPPGPFGAPGAYVVARSGRRDFVARVPLHETFELHDDGVLRCDHVLKFGPFTALRLHYRLTPA